jgi:hypothetical protein
VVSNQTLSLQHSVYLNAFVRVIDIGGAEFVLSSKFVFLIFRFVSGKIQFKIL